MPFVLLLSFLLPDGQATATYTALDNIHTRLGKVYGQSKEVQTTSHSTGRVSVFLGLPYAVPPLHELRFRPALLQTKPYTQGFWDASEFGPACCQSAQGNPPPKYQRISEDCLYLNIYAPTNNNYKSSEHQEPIKETHPSQHEEQENIQEQGTTDGQDEQQQQQQQRRQQQEQQKQEQPQTQQKQQKEKRQWQEEEVKQEKKQQEEQKHLLPVMVWIHGGSFVTGSGQDYDGSLLAAQEDVVVVTINYRLGPLGFLQSLEVLREGGSSWPSMGGMNGVNDQLVAIQWLRANIDDFGGDANKISMFGESAGGLSVCALLLTQLLKRPLYTTMVQSGACNGPWSPLSKVDGLEMADQRCAAAGYQIPSNLTQLRQIADGQNLTLALEAPVGSWPPSVDGYVLTDTPRNLLHTQIATKNAHTSMFGFNSMDGLVGWPWLEGPRPTTDQQYRQLLLDYFPENASKANLLYEKFYPPKDFLNASVAWYVLNGDICVTCPTLELAALLQQQQPEVSQYVYQFASPAAPFLAGHAAEIPFVFNMGKAAADFFSEKWSLKLSEQMMSAWAALASSGLPERVVRKSSNVTWDAFNPKGGSVLLWNDVPRNLPDFPENYRRGACHFLNREVSLSTLSAMCLNSKSVRHGVSGHPDFSADTAWRLKSRFPSQNSGLPRTAH
eukprot:gb/GEZN01002727.1/.p1 GENE.gb/GEZN01002727.1/~~gb/GEZN01002727.1/.p1  ORF type:complete len:670 (-),score=126.26 gb/GEZN01002727.1/:323-2332(-)